MAENNESGFDWNAYNQNKELATKKIQGVTQEFLQQKANEGNTYAVTSRLKNTVPNGFDKSTLVQNYLSGNSMTGPNPASRLGTPMDKQVDLFANKLRNTNVWQDPNAAFKATDYNGSRYGANFNRYYHHNKFNTLGFNPFRDNESLYNNNSSWWDDFSRMGGQWLNLWQDGVTGQFQNWGDYSLAGDIKHADQMESAMSIANSSKGGFGAFTTNLIGNFAYTAGVVSEMVLEEIALAGASFVTGGGLGGFAAVRTGQNAAKLTSLLSNALDYVKGVKSLKQSVQTLRNVSSARDFYNGAKTMATGMGSAAFKLLNPLEQSADFVKGFNQLKTVDKLSDMALIKKGFGAFYRDMRAVNAAFDEAKLEGGFVQNEMFDKLMEEYYNENGRLPEPESDDATRIYQTAKRAGDSTTLVNIPAILYSNKIVLDRALRGFGSTVAKTNSSIILNNKNWKKLGTEAYTKINNNVSKLTKAAYWKQAPRSAVGSLLTYGAANYVEGLQELYQEGASVAMKDYYTNMYKNPMLAGSKELKLKALGAGIDSQFSSQGLDVFLSGFLMGGLTSGVQSLVITAPTKLYENFGPDKILGIEIQNKEEIKKQREEQDKRLDQLVEALNAVEMNKPGATKRDIFNAIEENAMEIRNLAVEMEGAAMRGDAKTYQDAKNAMIVSHLHTLLSNDKYDIFINQLKEMRDLTDDELVEVLELNKDEESGANVRKRLEDTITNAETYKKNYNNFNQKFGRYTFPKDNVTGKAYEVARLHYTFNMNNLGVVAQRMESMLNEVVSNPAYSKMAATDLSVLFDLGAMKNEILTLQKELEVYTGKGATEEQKELAKEKKVKLDELSKIFTAVNNLTSLNKILETKDSRVAQLFEQNKTEEEFRAGISKRRDDYNTSVKDELDNLNNTIDDIDIEIAAASDQDQINKLNEVKADVQERITELNEELATEGAEYDKLLQMTREEFIDYETSKNQELLTKNIEELRKSYFDYMKKLSSFKEQDLLDDDLEDSLSKLIDFYALKDDQRRSVTAVNILSNPRNFSEHVERLSGIFEDIKNNRANYLKEGFKEFQKIKSENLFFQELFEAGMYLDPDSVVDFREGRMPNFFLAPTDLEKGDYVPVTAADSDPKIIEKYNQAMDILARHEARIGRPLMEKTIIERKGTEAFDESGFRKDSSDDRGLRELAATFGVDLAQRTDKKTKDVLAAIMASPQATEAEAMLARLLIPIVRNDSSIAFVTGLEQPGTSGTATGIQIDLRYGAKEFKNANTPMERIIIREVLKSILTVEYNKDDVFKTEIDRMFDNAKNWFELAENKEKYEALYDMLPLGLTSPEMFMTEAMSNPRFQALLGLIKSSKPNKTSIFQELIDSIRKVLLTILTGNMKNTLAQEAIDIISTRIFAPPTISGITKKLKDTSVETINEAIKNDEFDSLPKDLLAQMQAEAIANKASDYVEFYKSAPSIQPIINRYALRTFVQPEPFDEALLNLTAEQKAEHLGNLGYTEDEINKMSPEDQNTIIDNMIFAPGSEETKKREMVLIDIKKRLMPITNKTLELRTKEENGKKVSYYVDENGDEFDRVSDLKPEFTGKANVEKAAAARGTHTDDILRTYLDPESDITTFDAFIKMANDMMDYRKNSTDEETRTSFSNLKMTIDYYKDLYLILKDIRNTLKKRGFVLLTDVPTLWGQIDGNRAGTIDMLAVNNKGEVFIIDLKTAEANRFEATKTYKLADEIQLNAYRELLKQRTGIDIKNILVLPITVTYDNKSKSYVAAERSTGTVDGKQTQTMTIDSSKDIFEILNITPSETIDSAYEQELAQAMAALNQFPERYGYKTAEEVQALTSDQVLEVFRKGPVTAEETKVTTSAKADVEKEKATITKSEFKELTRLAKFFLENPKEPTVAGSVVSKYPALFKEITDIERRRQEDLIETPRAYSDPTMGYTVQYLVENGIIEGPIVKPGTNTYLRIKEGIDKLNAEINAKYDAELEALEEVKPGPGTQAELEFEEAPTVNINSEFLGKIIYATPGSGKTTLSRMFPDQVIDVDQVMADIIEETVGIELNDIQKNDIGGVIYDLLAGGQLDSKKFYDRVHKEMKKLRTNNKDKVILTGSLKFIEDPTYKKSINVMLVASDPVDFINHLIARGNSAEETETQLNKYRQAESLFGATASRRQKIINIGSISSDTNLANVITGQKEVTKAMTINKEDSQIILNFVKKIREAGTDLALLEEIEKEVEQYIVNRAKDMVTIDTTYLSKTLEDQINVAKGNVDSLDPETKTAVEGDKTDFPNGAADENDSDLPSDCGA